MGIPLRSHHPAYPADRHQRKLRNRHHPPPSVLPIGQLIPDIAIHPKLSLLAHQITLKFLCKAYLMQLKLVIKYMDVHTLI